MSDIVQSLRQTLQDVVAPELREHRVLLIALDSKIDSRMAELRAEIGGVRAEMSGMRTELIALDSKIDSRTAELRAEIGGARAEMSGMRTELTALDSKVDSRTAELQAEIGGVRVEMSGMRTELRGEISTVRAELDKVKLAVQNGFENLQHGLETAVLRGEVSTVRELADLRSRVDRIEDHLKLRQDEPGIQRKQ